MGYGSRTGESQQVDSRAGLWLWSNCLPSRPPGVPIPSSTSIVHRIGAHLTSHIARHALQSRWASML